MDDGFRVASGPEDVPFCLERLPELKKIIDFSVKNSLHGAILVSHRLLSCFQVNNAQPTVAKPDIGVHEDTFSVRATMGQGPVHPLEKSFIYRTTVKVINATYPAHPSPHVQSIGH